MTCRRARFAVALALMLTAASVPAQRQPTKLIIISWDGNAAWVIDRLLAEHALPNLARLARDGVRVLNVAPAFPSKTAPGHAAIWTGAYGDVSGITGNTVAVLPKSEHTILEQQDGFHSSALRAEPIWMPALRAGKRVAILGATHSTPAAPFLNRIRAEGVPADRLMSFDGFRSPISPAATMRADAFGSATDWKGVRVARNRAKSATTQTGDTTFHILIFDNATDPVDGFDTALVCPGRKALAPVCATLKPAGADRTTRHWSPPFEVMNGALFGLTYFRLFALSADGSDVVLYRRAANAFESTASRELTEAYLRASGGFTDEGFGEYRAGRLGASLWQRGDGTAERRLLEIIRLSLEFAERGTRFALDRLSADLLFHYSSATDSAGHAWVGVLDPESPAYDPALAVKLWPFYAEVFQLQDAWLGKTLDAAGPRAIVSIVGDHGMVGVDKTFYPNAVLERAGLLARTADGRIDLTKTQVCAPPWGDFFVVVNSTDWKGGIVPPAERAAVVQRAADALLSAVDPEDGRRIVTRVFLPDDVVGLGIGGPAGGDLYLDFSDGYAPSAAVVTDVVRKGSVPIGSGVHGFYPQRGKMQTVWFLSGPRVAAGRTIATARQIDIAPTLSKLLGIPAPRDAQGHIVGDVFADEP